MSHYEYTEVIKLKTDRLRRRQDRAVVAEQVAEFEDGENVGNRCRLCGPGACEPEVHEQDVWALLAGRPPDVT